MEGSPGNCQVSRTGKHIVAHTFYRRYGVCGARSVICAKVTDYEADIKTVHNL